LEKNSITSWLDGKNKVVFLGEVCNSCRPPLFSSVRIFREAWRGFEMHRFIKRPEAGALFSFIVVVAVFTVLSGGKFLRVGNIASILAMLAERGLAVIGITLLMISGEIDLSISSVYGSSALFFVVLSEQLPPLTAFLLVVLFAAMVGLLNGTVTTKFEVPSIIVTLGTMFFLRGVIYFTTKGFTRSFRSQDYFIHLLSGRIGGSDFRFSIFWLIVATLLFFTLLEHHPYGNHVLATGSNREVARVMGVKVDRVRMINFLICSIMASLGGMLSAARFGTVAATHGEGIELETIASAVIGGTLLSGGYGSIQGSLIGALLVSSLRSGLLLSGAPAYWYIAFMGVILVVAAVINMGLVRKVLVR
jgi:simple sugar transport system permease protein